MTLDGIVQAVWTLYEGDTDTPSSGEEDYTLITRLANAAINRWEHEDGVFWSELWVNLTDAADGDKTSADGTLAYDCPTDFLRPGGYVRLVDSNSNSKYFSVIPIEKVQLFDNEDKQICYFTGNPQDGFTLNFLDDPDGTYTIYYEYYKSADTLSATSDIPEMSDPYFIVYFVISRMYELDGQQGSSSKAFQESEARLAQMRTRNFQEPNWQDNRIEDLTTEQGFGGFGR